VLKAIALFLLGLFQVNYFRSRSIENKEDRNAAAQ